MKTIFALLLAGLMVFSFAGCNKENIEAGPDSTDHLHTSGAIKKINLIYGDDEFLVTVYKPEGAEFAAHSNVLPKTSVFAELSAINLSWKAEIMGYKYNEGNVSCEPFVDYYFSGSVTSKDYDFYEQNVTDLGFDFEGRPVKLIRYTYKKVNEEKENKECFVGFEYSGSKDKGLIGVKIMGAFNNTPSDNYIKGLFKQIFRHER